MPLMANWRQLCSSTAGMHAAARQRETLLRDLVRLSNSLAADVQSHLSNKSKTDLSTCSALATLQRLRREHVQEERDCDDAEFEQWCITATQQKCSAAQTPPCASSLSLGGCVAPDEQQDIANTLTYGIEEVLEIPHNNDNNNDSNNNNSCKMYSGGVLLDDIIHRRDALRDEVSELRRKNELAAILQEQLRCGVERISHTAHVALKDRKAFDALRELFDELFNSSEEWLALLEGMEQSATAAAAAADNNAGLQDAEENSLLHEIHESHNRQHVVLLAKQTAEKCGYTTRLEAATLKQQQYQQQMENEPRSGAHRQLLSSLLHSEAVAADADTQYRALRLQYAVDCLTRLQYGETEKDGDDDDDDELTQYVMQATSDTQRLTRILTLLKSIVVNYELDIAKLRQVNRLQLSAVGPGPLSNGERIFRAMQQEIKTAILPCLTNEGESRVSRRGCHSSSFWSMTNSKLQRKLPVHFAEVVRHALLALSAFWDNFSEREREKICAASSEMMRNGEFLLMIGRYVEARRRSRRVQRSLSNSPPSPESII
ncbi:hypothetical protein LSM04_005321 [Trypanosoma melophagium]|uniref:uncharacterized protein n=1 Tax=Trypanosoma melophagium TaxID=715481 RepID=UPI00351A12BB|nr:hypothetical protein LSM04_005321 [Trypanosoma melophagium]